MEAQASGDVKSEKENAVARFNRFRRILRVWRFFQVLVIFGLVSWSSTRLPEYLNTTTSYAVFNDFIVFLIGNAIVIALLVNFRKNDDDVNDLPAVGDDFCDEYMKFNRIEPKQPPPPETDANNENNQNVAATAEYEDAAAEIEKAARRINRFQRTQSEKLKQEIAVKPRPALRRSETENRWKTTFPEESDEAEIEALSNEEFRRRVDAFIDKHWINVK